MFAGFFTVKFKVGYFDMKEYAWKEGFVELPVMFLPAEAKLIEIRCVMDRAVDIYRDLMREVMYGIREAVFKPEQAIDLLRGFVEDAGRLTKLASEFGISIPREFKPFKDWFAAEIKNITGKEGAALKVDPQWVQYYSVVFNLASYREMINRLRYWLARIVAWAIYRLAYGYVTKEDLTKILNVVKTKAKLMDYEVDAIMSIAELLIGIAKREYIPTPYQLATIAEYVPEATKLINEVFEKRGVPPEWREIWRKFIEIRPLADEVRMLRTAVITAYARGLLSEEEFVKFLNELRQFGYTDRELQLLKTIAQLRRKYYESRLEIPTISQLAQLVEYVPEVLKVVDEVIKIMGISSKWAQIWKKYVISRSVASELRHLITRIEYLFSYGIIDLKTLQDIMNRLASYGLNELELKFELEYCLYYRLQRIMVQTIPSPIALTGYYRYVDAALDLMKFKLAKLLDINVLKQYMPESEAKKLIDQLTKFFETLARNKAVYPDLRGYIYDLIRAYEYGVIDETTLQRELNDLKQFGLKDDNIKLIIRRAKLRRLIREARSRY